MAAGPSIPLRAGAGASPQPDGAPQFLTTEEAGRWLRLSPRTLEKQRVLYPLEDLRAWADSRAYGMTSDPGYVQRDSVR